MRYIFLFVLALMFTQCDLAEPNRLHADKSIGSKDTFMEESEGMADEEDMDQMSKTKQPTKQNSDPKSIPKIIKNGNLSFEVDDLADAKVKVDGFIKSMESYFEDEQYNSSRHHNSYALTIRVPTIKFEELVALIESGVGKLEYKNISAHDVSEEYVDLNIRLKNNLAYLDQYKEVLKKAKSIKEILNVKERIRNLEMEIESKKGRIQFLDNRVSLATLQVQLNQKIKNVSTEVLFTKRVKDAFKNGYAAFLSFLIIIINLWPFMILVIGLLVFKRRIFRLFKRSVKS